MATAMQRGFRTKLDAHFDLSRPIGLRISVRGPGAYDGRCFGLGAGDKLADGGWQIFGGRTASPAKEIVMSGGGAETSFTVDLAAVPASINKLAFTVGLGGPGVMREVQSLSVTASQGSASLSLDMAGADFAEERALIAVEIYRKDVWRLAVVAGGFVAGLPAVLELFGAEAEAAAEEDLPPPPAAPAAHPALPGAPLPAAGPPAREKAADGPAAPPGGSAPLPPAAREAPAGAAQAPAAPDAAASRISLEKRLQDKAPELLSLAKPLSVALEKRSLGGVVARVALVLDISGSMLFMYKDGAVQQVINKTVPLAVQFDDDGDLDLWYYGSQCRRMPAVTLDNFRTAVPPDWVGLMLSLGGGNNEPVVMRDVIKEYGKGKLPAFVTFITDGGVESSKEIERLLIESSRLPIFWQFVGLGDQNYGVLSHFDTMGGRYVDNAGFFKLDDFGSVTNDELYDRLLGEFPQWLQAARDKGVLKGASQPERGDPQKDGFFKRLKNKFF